MAVQTGGNSSRKTAPARAISDLGALMSAKSDNNTDSQPVVVQVQAPVTPVPDSSYITTASQEANLLTVETVVSSEVSSISAQNQEQVSKEETIMSATQTASAPATTTAAAAAAPAPAATTAAPADATTATTATTVAPAAAESTNPSTPTWALLEGLEKPVVEEILDSVDGLRSTLSGRAERFSNLVAVTKDTVQRVDALEAKVAELQKGGLTRTVKFEHPDWKDEAVHGLVVGAAVGVGVLGIAYAFEAMFGEPGAVTTGEPAIQ